MKDRLTFTKTDLIFTILCIVFLIMNLGAIGKGGRYKAKAIVCSSNLRQLFLAGTMYANDNDGSLPEGLWLTIAGSPGLAPGGQWVGRWRPYYKDPNLLFCPAATKVQIIPDGYGGEMPGPGVGLGPFMAWGIFDEDIIRTADGWPSTLERGNKAASSYGINTWAQNPSKVCAAKASRGFTRGEKSWRTMAAPNGDEAPLMADCVSYDVELEPDMQPPDHEYDVVTRASGQSKMKKICLNRHNYAVNVVFLAGNVERVPLRKLWALKWHTKWNQRLEGIGWILDGLPPNHWMYHLPDYKPDWLD